MAARYLADVREVQPAGPYLLGGWSYGGVVAFEMARQLEAAGQEIALLALLDSELPAAGGGPPPDDAALLMGLCQDLEGMSRRRLGVTREDLLALSPLAPEAGLDLVLARALTAGVLPADADAGDLRRLAAMFRDNLRRLHDYRPEPCRGRMVWFRAEKSAAHRPARSWQGLAAGGLEIETVAGGHFTALQGTPRPRSRRAAGRSLG